MPVITKKLSKLLLKHKKANRARLTAYAKRSRLLGGVTIQQEDEHGNLSWKRVFRVEITDALEAELDANIEKARLYRLEVSAEVRAYCKKKKFHIKWNSDNHIIGVYSHTSWMLRKYPIKPFGDTLLAILHKLKLSTQPRYFWY